MPSTPARRELAFVLAVACAGRFPILHLGRAYKFYWLFPYPNTMGIWPQFRSPLIWDVFAVSTYGTVSALFWFTGLVPDMATLRDRAKSKVAQKIFGMLSLGWRGSARHWHRYEMAYLLLAGISTPLVLSVHSVVSFDFAVALNSKGKRAEAVDNLIEVVRRDRKWNDDGARKQLVQFFEAWGPTDDATVEGRKRLSSILFS